MRYSRQNKIIEIIEKNDVDTQEKLSALLKDAGFKVTQATISRDIKDLQLVKTLSAKGKYKYTLNTTGDFPLAGRYENILGEAILSIKSAENIIVVKTIPGCASAVAESIDSLEIEYILGTVAGTNTVLLVTDAQRHI